MKKDKQFKAQDSSLSSAIVTWHQVISLETEANLLLISSFALHRLHQLDSRLQLRINHEAFWHIVFQAQFARIDVFWK